MATPNLTSVPVTEEMTNAEAAKQNELDAGTGVEDKIEPETETAPKPEGLEPEPEAREAGKPIARSPQDDMRAQIANRFRRSADDVPFNGDLTDPEMLYGKAARAPAAEPDAEPSVVGEPAPVELPQKRTLKIRGRDVEMTDEEILAAAQKTLAADTYLEDARRLLEEAKTIKAERTGRDRQPPDGQSSTQDDVSDSGGTADQTQHPAADLKSVVEKIQYGDPDEAARELETIIDQRINKNVDQTQVTRLFNNDLAKAQKALKDFTEANPEFAKDDRAVALMQTELMDLYAEDLMALGLDKSQLPRDVNTRANWLRFYKIQGRTTRETSELLNTAKQRVDEWRGVSAKPTPQALRKEAPRVVVNVDRTERRLAIPNQPSRASMPRRDAAPAPTRTPGSDVVAQMRKSRGQV